jgi:hypothetical protein
MRIWCLAASAPGLWLIWLVIDGSLAKAMLLALGGAWLIAVFRLWFWSAARA